MKTIHDLDKKIDLGTLILILSVSLVIAYVYFNRVDRPNFKSRLELHNEIIAGTAPSPYRYRVLVPFVLEVFIETLSAVFSVKASFLLAYAIYDLLAVCFLLVTLFSWLRTWFSRDQSLIGVLFVAGTMPIALQDHYFQPWSLLEAGFFSAALLAIHSKRYWLLLSIAALAALNRETAIFIPLAFLLTIDKRNLFNPDGKKDQKPIVLFCGLFFVWAAVFLGLRYFLGSAPQIHTIGELFSRNTTKPSLLFTFINGSIFLGGFWVFALLGFRYAPSFIKQVAYIIPLYLLPIIIWGVWFEVRLLMPLYPVLIPSGLSFLYLRERKTVAA